MLGALLAFLESRVALALLLYLASVLTYEALAFFPLVLLAARPKDWLKLWPFGLALAAGLWWQRVGAARLAGIDNNKAMGFSPAHALKVFGAGFECNFNRVVHIGAVSWSELSKEAPALIFLAALAAAAAVTLLMQEKEAKPETKSAVRVALALFIAAYLPYAATADYTPQIFGLMSRTNATGAWAGGLALALLISKVSYRKELLFALVVFFVGADWQRARVWGKAWDAERVVLESLKTKTLPPDAVVLLKNAPNDIGRVPVFEAGYAFDGALRATLGRADVKGDLLRAYHGPVDRALVYDGDTGLLGPAK